MIRSTMVVASAYESDEPRVPIGKASVIAPKLRRPLETSERTVAAWVSAFWRSDQTAKPSFNQSGGAWKSLRVASKKTTWVTSWMSARSRYSLDPPPSHMKTVRMPG